MQAENLLKLQSVDQEIARLQREARVYPDRVQEARLVEARLRAEYEAFKKRLAEAEKEHQEMSATFELEDQRLKKSKTKIKQLKTPYEFQALNREIMNTERSNKDLEDSIVKKMEEVEDLKARIQISEQEWKTSLDEFQKKESEAKSKGEEFNQTIESKLEAQRVAREAVEKPLLAKYHFVQRRYSDALVAVKGSSCQGCFRNLPPQMTNEMRKNKLIEQCPNCSRLLYIP
jgi:uncharacterized protein